MSVGGGGQGPIESAYIEINADTAAAQRDIEAMEDDLSELDRFARLVSATIARHFQETGEILSRSFEEAKDASTRDLTAINRRIASAFVTGVRAAGSSIDSLSDSFERSRRATTADLVRINRNIATAFASGASSAERSMDEIRESVNRMSLGTSARILQINQNIARQFQASSQSAQRSIRNIGDAAAPMSVELSGHLLRINQNIAKNFRVGAQAANEALEEVGNAGTFTGATVAASQAAAFIARAFGIAARSSDEALDDIGGADAFAHAALSAELSASRIAKAFRNAGFRARVSLGGVTIGVTSLATALSVGSAALVAFATISTAQIERVETAFRGLLGNSALAGEFLEELLDLAANTPFEVQGLADSSAKLLAFSNAMGITKDEVLDTLTVIGDITTILGQPIEAVDSVVRALGQIASRGQVMTEELIQLSEALPGFAVFDELAQGLGVTTEALDEMLREGTVPAKEALDILVQAMKEFPGAAGAMEDASQTLIGLFSTLKDEVRLTLIDAFAPFTATLRTTMGEANDIVGPAIQTLAIPLNDLATRVLQGLVYAIENVTPAIGSFLQGIERGSERLAPFIRRLVDAGAEGFGRMGPFIDATAGALEPFIDLIAELASGAIPDLITVFAETLVAITPVISIFSELAGFVLPLLVSVIEAVPAPVIAAVVAMVQFQKLISLIAVTIPKAATAMRTGFLSSVSVASVALAALTIGLGIYAQKQAEARAEEAKHEATIDSFSRSLSDADTALAGTRTALEDLVEAGEDLSTGLGFFKDADAGRVLEELGLTAQQAAMLIQDGDAAVQDFIGTLDLGSNQAIVAASSFDQLSEDMQAAAEQSIRTGVAIGDYTQKQADAAIETNTARDGTVNFAGALSDLKLQTEQSADAATRHAEAEEARAAAMEATRQVSGLLATEIQNVIDNTGNLAMDLAVLGTAASNAELDEQQMAAAAEQLGVSVDTLGSIIGITEDAIEAFSTGVEGTFPSIADAIGQLDDITFDNLLETFRKTYEEAVNFEANLAILSQFPNVQLAAAQAGPQVAAVLAQGFKDGSLDSLTEMENLALGTQQSLNNVQANTTVWGQGYAATMLNNGIASTGAFGTGFNPQVTAAQRTQAAQTNIRNAKEGLQTAGSEAGMFASSGFGSGISPIPGQAGGIMGGAVGAVNAYGGRPGPAYNSGSGVGADLAAGVAAGIQSLEYSVEDKAQQLVIAAETAMRNAAQSKSPSLLFAELGKDIGAGVSLGIEDSTADVERKVSKLIQAASDQSGLEPSLQTGPSETFVLNVNVTAQAGMSDSEVNRFGHKIGDAITTTIERKRVRSEARRA